MSKYRCLYCIAPAFNRQRIMRHGVSRETPFIIRWAMDTPPLNRLGELLNQHSSLDVWEIAIPVDSDVGVLIAEGRFDYKSTEFGVLRAQHVINTNKLPNQRLVDIKDKITTEKC